MVHYSLLAMAHCSVRNEMPLVYVTLGIESVKHVPQHTTVCTSSTAACPGDSVWPIKTFTSFVWYGEVIFESCHHHGQVFHCDWRMTCKGHLFLVELWVGTLKDGHEGLCGLCGAGLGEESGHIFLWSCPRPFGAERARNWGAAALQASPLPSAPHRPRGRVRLVKGMRFSLMLSAWFAPTAIWGVFCGMLAWYVEKGALVERVRKCKVQQASLQVFSWYLIHSSEKGS